MQPTLFQTFDVPGASTADTEPLSIARGTNVSVRVVVKNVGAVPLFLAGADQDVVNPEGPTSKTWPLDDENAEVFVLAPNQLLFVVGSVKGGRVTVSVSEALPLL